MNRLNIINIIDNSTPRCVIYEIFQSLCFRTDTNNVSDDYINKIIYKIGVSHIDLDNENNIARFVSNAAVCWSKDKLNLALNHLMKFYGNDSVPIVTINSKIGPKTNLLPYSLDSCLLYKACRYNNIPTNRETTIYQMYFMLIDSEKAYDIIQDNIVDEIVSDLDIEDSNEYFQYLLKSDCKDNIDKLFLNEPEEIIENYCPNYIDSKIMDDPKDILKLYFDKEIDLWAKREGYLDNKETPKKYLLKLSDTYHIYKGIHPIYIKNNENPRTCIDLEDIYPNNIDLFDFYTFGILSNPKTLCVLHIDELIEFFKQVKFLVSPNDINVKLSESALIKLFNEQNESLNKIIEEIKLESNNNKAKESIKAINNLDLNNKQLIRYFFIILKDLVFYMRGWGVSNNTNDPLKSRHTNIKDEDFGILERNVALAYSKIRCCLKDMSQKVTLIIENLPLLFMMRDGNNLEFAPMKRNVTILERLNVVFEDVDDENSCIRTSSSLLAYSIYYYVKNCFNEELFDINKLDLIL